MNSNDLAQFIENARRLCENDPQSFREYLNRDASSLKTLDWLYRRELAKTCLANALRDIDPETNAPAYGCVSRIKEMIEITPKESGDDPDYLSDFVEACRILLAEARADLLSDDFDTRATFLPVEIYLAILESGTF